MNWKKLKVIKEFIYPGSTILVIGKMEVEMSLNEGDDEKFGIIVKKQGSVSGHQS